MWQEPFPSYSGPKPSRVQEEKERKRLQKLRAEGQVLPATIHVEAKPEKSRRRVSHFVMNLPDSAIEFLDAFRGILSDADPNMREAYEVMPMVHCHCFTRELEQDKAEADIRRVSRYLINFVTLVMTPWTEGGGKTGLRSEGGVVPPRAVCGTEQGNVLHQLQTAR